MTLSQNVTIEADGAEANLRVEVLCYPHLFHAVLIQKVWCQVKAIAKGVADPQWLDIVNEMEQICENLHIYWL